MDLSGGSQHIVISDGRIGFSQLEVNPGLIQQGLRIDAVRRIYQVVFKFGFRDPFILFGLGDGVL